MPSTPLAKTSRFFFVRNLEFMNPQSCKSEWRDCRTPLILFTLHSLCTYTYMLYTSDILLRRTMNDKLPLQCSSSPCPGHTVGWEGNSDFTNQTALFYMISIFVKGNTIGKESRNSSRAQSGVPIAARIWTRIAQHFTFSPHQKSNFWVLLGWHLRVNTQIQLLEKISYEQKSLQAGVSFKIQPNFRLKEEQRVRQFSQLLQNGAVCAQEIDLVSKWFKRRACK